MKNEFAEKTVYKVEVQVKGFEALGDLVKNQLFDVEGGKATKTKNEWVLDAYLTQQQVDYLVQHRYTHTVLFNATERGRERQAEVSVGNRFLNKTKFLAPEVLKNAYLNVAEVETWTATICSAFPTLTQLIPLPEKSVEGRTIHAIRIGRNVSAPAVFFLGGVHAREWGSPDIVLNFAWDILNAYHSNTGLVYGGATYSGTDISNIINKMNVIILPCANPDGRKYSQETYAMWRKNRNPANSGGDPGKVGVDINRNYDFLWDFEHLFAQPQANSTASSNPQSETYHGPHAFSEPETRNVKWIMDHFPVYWFIDIHSYARDILYNWGDDNNQTTDPAMNFRNAAFNTTRGRVNDAVYKEYIPAYDQNKAINLGQTMKFAITAVRGEDYTNKQSVDLYATSGTSDDYAYSRHFINPLQRPIIGFTIEWGTEFQPAWAEMQNIIKDVSSALTAFCVANNSTYYFEWRGSGTNVLDISCPYINAHSNVMAAISEFTHNSRVDRFVGAATLTVCNVAPYNGGVRVWTEVGWPSPLNISIDLLIN